MLDQIPSVEVVREALATLSLRQIDRLSDLSGVPAPTICKIRRGETENPGMETVRKFAPHISAARIADPTWPHPGGRPTIDVAGPAAAEVE